MALRNDISQAMSLSIWHATFGCWPHLVIETVYVSGFMSIRQKDCQTVTKAKTSFSFEEREMLLYQHHLYLITVLLFQHLFQTQYLMFYSTYQRATPLLTTAWPLSPNSSNIQSVFSFHIDKLCVYVWINIVDIKPNLCLYTSSTNPTAPSKIHQTLLIVL